MLWKGKAMHTRIGKYIHEKRIERRVKLKDVSERLHITVTNVHQKEKGLRKFRLEEVVILSDMLDFSLDEMKKQIKE